MELRRISSFFWATEANALNFHEWAQSGAPQKYKASPDMRALRFTFLRPASSILRVVNNDYSKDQNGQRKEQTISEKVRK